MLAKYFKYSYLDSGAMYRGITYAALQNKWITPKGIEESKLFEGLKSLSLNFDLNSNLLLLNGVNISKEIRNLEVSKNVSQIASLPLVRDFLVTQQRKMGNKKNIVIDGRDIGTVVFPDAAHKFFFTAQPEVRAKRRWEELKVDDPSIDFDSVLENLVQRDTMDSNREEAPLKIAKNAIEINVSDLSVSEIFNLLIKKIET
jgi:cytidylate kinase